MTVNQIITESAGYVELADGEALYYIPQTDSVDMGRDGCQPSNSLCLRVGPDHTSNLDWQAITDSVTEFLAR